MANFKSMAKTVGQIIKKELPTIFTFLGVGGVMAATVIACDKSRDLDDLLDDVKENIEEKKAEITEDQNHSAALTKIYICAGGKIAKHYWLPAVIELGSLTLIIAANAISRSRINGALAMCSLANFKYNELKNQFSEYIDNDIQKAEEDPSVPQMTEREIKLRRSHLVDLSFFYDERFPTWSDEPFENWKTVMSGIQWAEEELRRRAVGHFPGRLTVGEIEVHWGLPKQLIPKSHFRWGWNFYNYLEDVPENSVYSNGTIDLGLYDYVKAIGKTCEYDPLRAFMEGTEPCVLLDPKVDEYFG